MLSEFQLTIEDNTQKLGVGGGLYGASREVEFGAKFSSAESRVEVDERQLGYVEA